MTRQSVILVFASVAAAVISYLFHPFLTAGPLGPEGIAVLGVFLSLNYMLSFPQRPVDMALTRDISAQQAAGSPEGVRAVLWFAIKKCFWAGLLANAGLLAVSPLLARYLNLNSARPVIAAILLADAGVLLTLFRAPLQGLLRFGQFGWVLILDPVVRLALGASFIHSETGVQGAMEAYVCGYLAACMLGVFFLRSFLFGRSQNPLPVKLKFSMPLPLWIYSFYMAAFVSVDVLMVKHYFGPHEAGLYIAASTLAKMSFVVIGPVGNVAYSMLCDAVARKHELAPVFRKGLALSMSACLAIGAVIFILPEFWIRIVYGKSFAGAAAIFPYAYLPMIPFTLIINLSHYFLAQNKNGFVYGLLAGLAAQAGLIFFFHATLWQVITGYAAGGVIQLALAWGAVIASDRRKRNNLG